MNKKNILEWSINGTLDKNLASNATKKNHKHIHGRVFKSIRHSELSPAWFRHLHKGKKK